MAALDLLAGSPQTLILAAAASLLAIVSLFAWLFQRPSFPSNAPAFTIGGSLPVIGAGLRFFNERWDFHREAASQAKGGAFSYYIGPHPVIGLTGEQSRKLFFENSKLNFTNAYTTLFGGGAQMQKDNEGRAGADEKDGSFGEDEAGFGAYFNRRLIVMLKGPQLKRGLPKLLKDTRARLDALKKQSSGITDPFDSIYRIVFQLTMRTVACDEIAEDDELRERCLQHFESLDSTTNAWSVMYSWFPWPSTAKRTYHGARLYMIFKKIIDNRRKHNITGDDALQYLMDQGDNVTDMLTFVLGSLFAGQLNSGINAAFLIANLGNNEYWKGKVLEEVHALADKYSPNKDRPLADRLMDLPMEAWEGEFTVIDMCLKDSIRLNLPGTGFRQNLTGQPIPLDKTGTTVIPHGTFLTYASGETYYNEKIFPNPNQWDPARYMPERAEDKKEAYAWAGWGAGRHPCLGMRFAKLEMSMIVAFFVAYFPDYYLCDKTGARSTYYPPPERNRMSAGKPSHKVYVKYK